VIQRILGFIMFLTGLVILILALAGAYFVGDVIDNLADGLSSTLTLAVQSLDSARDTLDLARATVDDVHGGLDTAVAATANASRAIADSRPLLDNVAAVTTQEVPEAVEGIQAALPNMIQVAAVIDDTLTTLSSIGIDRQIPLPFGGSIPLQFDLGIDYNPTTSFDDSLRVFEASLTGLPESLRGLEDDLRATNDNLALLVNDLQATSDNLTTINTRIGEMLPLLDQYATLVDQLSQTVTEAQSQVGDRLELVRVGAIALLIAVGLTQLAPLYLGWELVAGRRMAPAVSYPLPVAAESTTLVVPVAVKEPVDTIILPPDSGVVVESPGEEDHA
jgi:hypothetical protein